MMKKILHNPQALIGLALIALVTAVALLAPVLAPHAPDAVNLALKYQPASSEFPLGTDQLGRCELSRLRVLRWDWRCRSWCSWAQLDWGWD